MIKITKRNGKVVNFNEEKIENAIRNAFLDKEFIVERGHTYKDTAKVNAQEVTEKVINRISRDYKEEDVLSVEDVQDIVEDVLMKTRFKDVAKSYIKYRHRKALSRQKFSDNQAKLIKTIEKITFEESEDNDLKRENANVNGNSAMGTMLQYGSTLSKDFAITHLLNEEHSKAHHDGDIHIHDLDFFAMGTTTCLVGDTFITLKDSNGKIINTTISYLDKLFKNEDNLEPEVVNVNNYYILGRNGWTLLKNAMRRKISNEDKLYFLKTSKGLGLKATDKHKIPVIRDGEEVLLKTEEIVIGDSLLTNPHIIEIEKDEYINLAEVLMDNESKISKDKIYISNIDKLRKWMLYKYDVKNFSNFVNSKTYRNGTSYILLEQLDMLTKNYDIPYEVLITLGIKIKNSKSSFPILLPITNELAKFFGYIYSDGNIYTNRDIGAYHINFINRDKEILKHFDECATSCFMPNIVKRYQGDVETGRTISDKMISYLVSEVIGKKNGASQISIPDFIFNASDEIKYSFISAIIDGDGSVTDTNSNLIRYFTVCEKYAEELVLLLKSLNIDSSISKINSKGTIAKFGEVESIRNHDMFTVTITSKKNLGRLLSNLNAIKRNQEMLDYAITGKTIKLDPERIVDKIELSDDVYVYDLETVEHWFLANNYVVHNCNQLDLDKLFKDGFSTGHGFIREPQSIASYASLTAIVIQANQNDQHGGQSINSFDYYLAPGVLKSFKKLFKENLENYILFDSGNDSISNFEPIKTYVDSKVETINLSEELLEKLTYLIMMMGAPEENAIKVVKASYRKALQKTEKETFQAMESLVHNLNTMNSRAGSQVPFSSINFGTNTTPEGRMVSEKLLLAMNAGLGKGETAIFPILIFKVKEGINYNPEDINYDLFKLAIKVSAKRLFPNFSFLDAPFNLSAYEEGNHHSEVAYMGCRTRVMSNECGPEQSTSRGNLSFTSINLPRLGIKHGITRDDYDVFDEDGFYQEVDMETFYNELEEKISLIKDQLLERFKYQCAKKVKNSPFLMGQGMWLDSDKLDYNDTLETVLKHGTLSVGFIGLAECLKALTGKHHGESEEAQKLGLEIIGFIRNKLDEYSKEYGLNFSLIATPK